MRKILHRLLLLTAIFPTQLLCEEFSIDKFYGIKLAFTRLPSTPVERDTKEPSRQKSKSAPAVTQPSPLPATKPSEAPVPKPVVLPETKTSPALEKKPAQISPVRPIQNVGNKINATQDENSTQTAVAKNINKLQWVAGLGFDNGGDELGVLSFTSGSSSTIKANKGYFINAGVILPNGSYKDFSTQLTVGYKLGGAKGGDGSVYWSAIPLELIEYYNLNNIRLGLGISYQIKPQLSISIPGTNTVDQYKNALGLVIQMGWAPVAAAYSVDLRYTSIKFQLEAMPSSPSVDGSVFGIYGSYRY